MKYLTKNCEACDSEFTVEDVSRKRDKKCCSRKCSADLQHLQSEKKNYECDICNKNFLAPVSFNLENKKKYCSQECKKKKHVNECIVCENEFRTDRKSTKYCSDECKSEGINSQLIKFNCTCCGKECKRPSFTIRDGNLFCGQKCRNKYLESINDRSSSRYGSSWRYIREEVIRRDNQKCRSCSNWYDGANKMHVHHIVEIEKFENIDDANTLSNLALVCWKCHKKIHSGEIENIKN